ncbi:MAG: hypothetical protein J7K22_03475 [Nanoarchaeota archaeon]|nr:hypothetical protein [Nanoarchaeota archaeon]
MTIDVDELGYLVSKFNDYNLETMLVGGMAISLYAVPVTTKDVDFALGIEGWDKIRGILNEIQREGEYTFNTVARIEDEKEKNLETKIYWVQHGDLIYQMDFIDIAKFSKREDFFEIIKERYSMKYPTRYGDIVVAKPSFVIFTRLSIPGEKWKRYIQKITGEAKVAYEKKILFNLQEVIRIAEISKKVDVDLISKRCEILKRSLREEKLPY